MKDALKNWPVMGATIGVVAVTVLGLSYWSNVKDRERYLQSRNFRLLAVLARQTEQLFENRGRVYWKQVALSGITSRGGWIQWPAGARSSEDTNDALQELESGEVLLAEKRADNEKSAGPIRYKTHIRNEGSSLQFEWIPEASGADKKTPDVSIRVPAGKMLDSIFDPKLDQGAFDTLLLSDTNGVIVYAVGRRTTEIRATSIAALLPEAARTKTGAIADRVSETPVLIAGAEYRMFMQPCCRAEGAAAGPGFVVVGLVESEAMLEASLAISPVLVLAGAVLVLALLVGWSFLKVAFIGSQQRVTRVDVLQLGASGIFGLALATILLLTTSSYSRLSADVDAQLADLAERLHGRMSDEINNAATQLQKMTTALKRSGCIEKAPDKSATPPLEPCQSMASGWSRREDLPGAYTNFNAFALVDNLGLQRVKAAFTADRRSPVSVADRDYFHRTRTGQGLWKVDSCPDGCALESHWSWTTGQPQVVLAIPTKSKRLPVAALSIPMLPLLEPVMPQGFEFAVIDQKGLVHFHSDRQRNVHENLLVEADGNRRLQSLVATHSAGTINTSYWGRPYRAYVRPTLVPGWSVVTLHAKQPGRALVLEWSTVALLVLTGYMLVWVALTLILMSSDASWLWPDPLRRPWYRLLAVVYGGSFAVWVAAIGYLEPITILWTGLCLPPALWGLTCIVLAGRPKDVGQPKAWSDLRRDYHIAAALMLAITATVPGAAVFAFSSNLHLGAYLKEQQIALAHRVERLLSCESHEGPPAGIDDVHYASILYGTEITCAPPAPRDAPAHQAAAHAKYEDYVPYFTPAAIALRELMHEQSDDDAWVSRTPSTGTQAVTVRVQEPAYRLDILSQRLPILGFFSLGSAPRFVRMAMLSLFVLAGLVVIGAYWIVRYLLHRVVLADVVEPVCTNGHVVTSPGQHVLVICAKPSAFVGELKDVHPLPLMQIVTATNVANAWRQARREVSQLASTQRIVIPDLDEQSDDVALMRRKLELVDDLMADPEQTVLLLTTMSKRALASSVRDSWKWSQEPEHWSKVLAGLTVIDTRPADSAAAKGAGVKDRPTWLCEVNTLLKERIENLQTWWSSDPPGDWRKRLLDAEAQDCPAVEPFCRDLESTPAFKAGLPTRDQILEELEERAASIYRNLWQSCSEDERIVLEHVAQHGLASAASRRVVRRLLARGLLRKDPELRLMNGSFRRYVLESERRHEVATLERQAGPSLWDRLRFPLGMATVIAVAFLAVTQRDAFDATLTMAAGVTTAIPTLAKLIGAFAQLTAKGDSRPANA